MTDSNDKDRKPDASRPGGGTLTLKRPSIEQSKVKQSFGAGRSKTVVVETKIVNFGRTSFDIEYRLLRGEETAIECQEKRVLVARDPETGKLKPFPIPDEVKALFA